jgi:ribonucleoside-diphosphate reductase alpha chain
MSLISTPQKLGDYYTLAGAANALGLSYWTVYRYVRLSRVPVLKLGRLTLVRLEDVRLLGMSHTPTPAGTEAGGTGGARRERCPECGESALVYEEGCQKCYACGYSAC